MITTILFSLLGYAAVMWVLVLCLYFLTSTLRGAHPMIIVHAPLLPFFLAWEGVERFREEYKKYQTKEASRWIASELRKVGITVDGEFGIIRSTEVEEGETRIATGSNWRDHCEVFAVVPPGKEGVYGDVYARAIPRFPHLSPGTLCASSEPRTLLDEAWAKRHGFSEYFATEYFAPCVDCGVILPWYEQVWGDASSHQLKWWSNHQEEFYFKDRDRPPRIVRGYICPECDKKIGWHSKGGHFFQDERTA